jgi:hypothetical protein
MPKPNHSRLPCSFLDVSAPLTKLTIGDRDVGLHVVLDAAVESFNPKRKQIDAGGAMIIAAFLPRW